MHEHNVDNHRDDQRMASPPARPTAMPSWLWRSSEGAVNVFDAEKVRRIILSILANRPVDATICPSEVARALTNEGTGAEWRKAMPVVHTVVDDLLMNHAVQLSWKGKRMMTRSGPYRIGFGNHRKES